MFKSVDLHSVLVFTAFPYWAKLNRDSMQSVDLVAVLFFNPHSLLSAFLHLIPDPLTGRGSGGGGRGSGGGGSGIE